MTEGTQVIRMNSERGGTSNRRPDDPPMEKTTALTPSFGQIAVKCPLGHLKRFTNLLDGKVSVLHARLSHFHFSFIITRDRSPNLPLARAAAGQACVLSWMNSRSASVPNTWNIILVPCFLKTAESDTSNQVFQGSPRRSSFQTTRVSPALM